MVTAYMSSVASFSHKIYAECHMYRESMASAIDGIGSLTAGIYLEALTILGSKPCAKKLGARKGSNGNDHDSQLDCCDR